MSGAGSAEIAFTPGTGFNSIAGSPTYYRPGKEITLDNFQINNNNTPLRSVDETEPGEFVEGNFEGEFSLTYTMSGNTHDDVRGIVFNDGGTGITTGLAPTSRWFIGTDYLDASNTSQTVELELHSCIPRDYSITYEQGTNTVRESLTMQFADLRKNSSKTPSSPTGPNLGDEVAFHGVTGDIGGSTINEDQAITVEWTDMYRYHRDSSRHPTGAVDNAITPQVTSRVRYHTDDYLGLTLSGDDTSATQPQTKLNEVNGSVELTNTNGRVAKYDFSNMSANQHSLESLVQTDSNFEGVVTWQAGGGTSIST